MSLLMGGYRHNVSDRRSRKEPTSPRLAQWNCCKGKPGMLYERLMQTVKCKASIPSILWGMKRNAGHTSITALSIDAAHHVFAKVFPPDRQEDAGLFVPNAYAI